MSIANSDGELEVNTYKPITIGNLIKYVTDKSLKNINSKEKRKIIDYIIVSSYEEKLSSCVSTKVKFDDLEEEIEIKSPEHYVEVSVKHLLRKGFELHGLTQISVDTNGYACIFQAMVKYED